MSWQLVDVGEPGSASELAGLLTYDELDEGNPELQVTGSQQAG
jgi:hypothetical protein